MEVCNAGKAAEGDDIGMGQQKNSIYLLCVWRSFKMPSRGLRYSEIIELPGVSYKDHPEEM